MNKYIHRRLGFSADEVRTVLTLHLKTTNKPYPALHAPEAKFSMTENGALLEWVEDLEENV